MNLGSSHEILKKQRDRRFITILVWIIVCLTLITSRLTWLQTKHQEVLMQQSQRNFLRTESVAPLRGNIFDTHGRVIVANQTIFDLHWMGTKQRTLTADDEQMLQQLETILGAPIDRDQVGRVERTGERMLLQASIPFEKISQISELFGAHPHLVLTHYAKRHYPYQEAASHVLGYLGRSEKYHAPYGVSGIEKMLHDVLQGSHGYTQHIINARGEKVSVHDMQPAQAGKDITLTIDIDAQRIAESAFTADQTGSFVVLDPADGAIKALVSYPNFDPNRFLYPISPNEWQEKFQANSPLLNRVTHGLYPPASIFKLITFTAGLEEGIITPETTFDCKGHVLYCGRKYYCQRHWGHGTLDAKNALAHSCNIPCFNIAKELTIDTLAYYAQKFGLGIETGCLLPEQRGLMPTSWWKKQVKHESWWGGETLSASIGQSYILATPLQLARAIGSIFAGYLVKPRLLTSELVEASPLTISNSTRHFLQTSMELGAAEGTSRRLGQLKEFKIHAKTGTAQTSGLRKQEDKSSRNQYEHGWIGLCFSYQNQPPLVLVAIIEHAGSSRSALELTQKFLRGYAQLQKQRTKPI